MKNIFYFPLEPLKERYTAQLSLKWIPNAFEKYKNLINFIIIEGEPDPPGEIKVGMVLDAVGRGKYSMKQCINFLNKISSGEVQNGDVIFLQDFWTPGIESIFYALDLYGIKDIKIYATCWAQSVDEYDFTYKMKSWMRNYELGLDTKLSGIFVGNTIHRDQLKAAGFNAPIHVVSLTVDKDEVRSYIDTPIQKEKIVIFTSRFDTEKNPLFMLEVAKEFLKDDPDYEWHCTTSASKLRSNDPYIIQKLKALAWQEPRFKILTGLTKTEYYNELSKAEIQFNSSLQDYVSWTLIESTIFGCDPVYPNFRCFPEIINARNLYMPFNVDSAVNVLMDRMYSAEGAIHDRIPIISDLGRHLQTYIIVNGFDREVNVWNEYEYFKNFLND